MELRFTMLLLKLQALSGLGLRVGGFRGLVVPERFRRACSRKPKTVVSGLKTVRESARSALTPTVSSAGFRSWARRLRP